KIKKEHETSPLPSDEATIQNFPFNKFELQCFFHGTSKFLNKLMQKAYLFHEAL
ncbi:hypothetical protein glysoja_036392, partial [Glycine soja]